MDTEPQNVNPAPDREFLDIIDHHRQLVADDEDGQVRVHSPNTAIPKHRLQISSILHQMNGQKKTTATRELGMVHQT